MRLLIAALVIILAAMFIISTLPSTEYGAVILIGPLPIIIASNAGIVLPLLIFALFLIVLLLLFSHFISREVLESEKLSKKELEIQKPEKKFGGLVLIGPLPIIFGDAKIAIFASLMAIVLMILAILLMGGWFM